MDTCNPTLEALGRAVEAAGGQAALARALAERSGRPVRQGHVWSWMHRTGRIPAEYTLEIERLTGVSRHELRPDIYPRDVCP